MPQNFFITGDPKAGKTTLLKQIVAELKAKGLKVGGIISPEERHHGTRTAFHVMSVESGREAILASVDGDGPKVSKYHVDIKSFESVAIPVMERFGEFDVFVIDEIGRMELKSRRFAKLLDQIIESHTPLVATLHRDYVQRYGTLGQVFELALSNREAVFVEVLKKADVNFQKRKTAKAPALKAAKKTPAVKAKGKKPAKKQREEKPAKKKPGEKAVKPKAEKPERRAPAKEEKRATEKAGKGASPKAEKSAEKKGSKGGLFHKIKGFLHG